MTVTWTRCIILPLLSTAEGRTLALATSRPMIAFGDGAAGGEHHYPGRDRQPADDLPEWDRQF